MRWLVAVLLTTLAVSSARAQERSTDADDPVRLRGELLSLRKELKDMKARLAHLEQQMATIAAQTSDQTKPTLDQNAGFVVPNLPRGSDYGCASAGELAKAIHHAATSGEHDLEKQIAFNRIDFFVPESLWSQASKGLKTIQGLPTRDELELALSALKGSGSGSQLLGIRPANELAPSGSGYCIQVVDLNVGVESRTDHYRLTAVRLCGKWFAAHLLALGVEEDARSFLEDLVSSQRAFNAFRQGRYARNLHELAGARELERNANIKAAGLTFPLGQRLDRLEKDKLEWVGNDLRGPFYRYTLTGDEKSGWSAVATPRSPSYWTFSVTVLAGTEPSKKVEIKRFRASGEDSKRRDGEPEGD